MAMLFFVLDLRALSPPLLQQLKQSLLELANSYALSPPPIKRRKLEFPTGDCIGLCYLQPSPISSFGELKIAYSPRGNGFNLHDFHYAVNHLPSDCYSMPSVDDSGSFLFRDVDFSSILSDQVLYPTGNKDLERRIIIISSCLVGNMDSNACKLLQDAADRCISVEFVFLEQLSSHLSDISENISKFRGQICELENCSFNSHLPDALAFIGPVKRWLKELKDNSEDELQAHFIFQKSINGYINKISCKLCNAINQIMDGFGPCKSCWGGGHSWDGVDGCTCKASHSSHVTDADNLGHDNAVENSKKVNEHTVQLEASWRNLANLRRISTAIDFNVIERTSLVSLSEGVIVGRPYIVIPSLDQEADTTPEESDKCQLNNKLFHGLCRVLCTLNQGLVCWSLCNIEAVRETAFRYYYILQPSANGPMLLRRLAGAEEMLPFPDINLADSLTSEAMDTVQICLREVELRDYNPVQHSGGFHQKVNELIEESSQLGLVNPESVTAASDSTYLDSFREPLHCTSVDDSVPQHGTRVQHQDDEPDKGIACLSDEWEQLIVGDIPRLDPRPSLPKFEKLKSSPPASQRRKDTRTSKILERLGNPKQMKSKFTSPTSLSGVLTNSGGMKENLPAGLSDAGDQILTTSSQLMKPNFQRLKRKQR